MPKLKKTEAERRMERLDGLVVMLRSACIIQYGDLKSAAGEIGIDQSTLYRKFRDPESMTLGQLETICRALPNETKETIRKLMLP